MLMSIEPSDIIFFIIIFTVIVVGQIYFMHHDYKGE